MERPKTRNTLTDNCSVVNQVLYHSVTWVYRSITVSYPIKNENVLKNELKKKLICWKGNLMSYGGRLVLINSVLTSMSMFLISFFKFRKGFESDLISLDLISFGSLMRPRGNTVSRDGISYADLNTKVVSVLRT